MANIVAEATSKISFESSDYHETSESFDAGKHGKDYEKEISKFIFKRLIDKDCTNFKFTREKKGIGKFDDIVVITDIEGKRKCSLIQLKHIKDDTKMIKSDSLLWDKKSYFYLPKYFNHYLESLNNISKDLDFIGAELELFLCTNIEFDDNSVDLDKLKLTNDGIFNGSGELYKLQLSNCLKRQVFADSYVSDTNKLAKELCSHFMLNKHLDINCLVRNEHVSLLKKYHVALATNVIDIHRKKFKLDFLNGELHKDNNISAFREMLLHSLNDFFLLIKNSDIESVKQKLNINLRKLEELQQWFVKYNEQGPINFLKEITINTKSGFGNSSLYPDYSNCLPPISEIYIDGIDDQIQQFLEALTFAVGQRNNETRIREEMTPDTFIAYNDKIDHWYHSGSVEDSEQKSIRKREWITKEKLVHQTLNSCIKFQNIEITLNQLNIDETLLDPTILMQVFCSQEISICSNWTDAEDINRYYISRFLTHEKRVEIDILKEGNVDIIILSNNSNDNFTNNGNLLYTQTKADTAYGVLNIKEETRYVHVGNCFQEKDFNEFINKYKEIFDWKNFLWFEVEGTNLLWKKSYGSFSILQKYLYKLGKEDAEIVTEVNLFKHYPNIIIIGEPGMGKSTLFQHIAESFVCNAENDNPNWVIKILLKDCVTLLDKIECFRDLDGILDFLSHTEKLRSPFYKSLLNHCLLNDRVILMFDGFDELNKEVQKQKVIQLLDCLQINARVKQIWISSRPHCRESLENCLNVVSFSLKEINEEHQISFLSSYWKQNSNKSEEHIQQYTRQLITNFNLHVKDYEKNFLGIPLQTYMFAVVFLEEIMKEKPVIQETLPITFLFKQFLHVKYDVYLTKSGASALAEDIKHLLMQLLDEAHQNFAIRYGGLLSEKESEAFISEKCVLTDERLLDVGIVYKVNDDFHFIHKTFSEYLTAKRMADVVLLKGKDNSKYANILENLISKPESKFLLYLFDHELAEMFPLHKSVLNGDEEKVRKITYHEVDARDFLGRSLIYYAIQYRHLNIMNLMLRHMKRLSGEIVDNFFVKSLLAYIKNVYNSNFDNSPEIIDFLNKFLGLSYTYRLLTIEEFNIPLEMKRGNWPIVKKILLIRRLTGLFGDNASYFQNALLYKAPLPIVVIILDSIRLSIQPLDQNLLTYSYLMEYFFICELDAVEGLLLRYKLIFERKFDRVPLYVGTYEYFDLRRMSFGASFLSLLGVIRKRADDYANIVRILLENGSSYVVVKNDDINDIFRSSKYNLRLFRAPIKDFFDNLFISRLEYFDSTLLNLKHQIEVDQQSSDTSSDSKVRKEFWNSLEEYVNDISLDMNENVFEACVKVVFHILHASKAKELLYLAHSFHKAVKENKTRLVLKYLKEAKSSGWKKSLLKSTNEDSKIPETIAKENFNLRMYCILRKHRIRNQSTQY